MTKTTKTLIASAAIAGLISGAAVRAGTIDSGKTSVSTPSMEKMACSGKESCKGKNECKGKGGCKTDKNECKGKNDCKGKGGCKATEDKK